MFTQLAQFILKVLSRAVILKYKPKVVGITGSVGKTSVKMVAGTILAEEFHTRASPKSYNNEFGVPLTVIGAKGGSIAGGVAAVFKALRLLIMKDRTYPEILVLEMGADHPGDLDYLLRIATPHIGALTGIGPTHTEFFKTVKRVLQEKQKVVMSVPASGIAILNADDELVMSVKEKIKARVIDYGLTAGAEVGVADVRVQYGFMGTDGFPSGMQFKVEYAGSVVPMAVEGVLGESAVSTVLGGAAIGIACGMHLVEIGRALPKYEPPPGRMRLLSGIKRSLIVDDSYNASPKAVKAAIAAFEAVKVLQPAEKWLVLGDMRELGDLAEESHHEVGRLIAKNGVHHLVTVGELAKEIGKAACDAGFDEERVFEFADSESAGKFIQEKLRPESALLIKGSQAMRMEKIVKELMADPLSASQMLVRQGEEWE